jgi:hypothetical protein
MYHHRKLESKAAGKVHTIGRSSPATDVSQSAASCIAG